MSKQPLGKTLLRNVIRHTDAHNKIQEELEMWKMRGWETRKSDHKHLPNTDIMRGSMHCDRVPDESGKSSAGRERVSEHDDREARYWTRKLYEFEASDPDRWGHSGFKELYPEEFDNDSDKGLTKKKTGHRKMKKSKCDTEACLSKQSKKSSRKKKKKKTEEGKRKKGKSSNDDSGSDDRSDTKDKKSKKKRTKSRHKNKKNVKARGRDEDSSSGGSGTEGKEERRTNGRKKRKRDSHSELHFKKKRRKHWKAAGEGSSDDSSAD